MQNMPYVFQIVRRSYEWLIYLLFLKFESFPKSANL